MAGKRRMRMRLVLALFCSTGLAGCADLSNFGDGGNTGDAGGTHDFKDLQSLRIEPIDAVLYVTDGQPVTLAYRALGTFRDGTERDVTGQTTFEASDTWVGIFKDNVFQSGVSRGGKTTVQAQVPNGETASTGLTVVFKRTFFGPGVAPAVAAAFDGASEDPGRAPELAYPADGVLLPPNLRELEFQWLPGPGNNVFEVSLVNDGLDIRFYVGCSAIGSGCGFVPPEAQWDEMVIALRGADAAELRVRGGDKAGLNKVGVSAARTVSVAQEDILGGLYYWNASPGTIVRYDFGKPKQKAATFYNSFDAGAMLCVGCHSLSRDGSRMAVGLDMPAPAPLKVLEVATRQPLASGAANFMTFSPDSSKLITSDGNSLVLRQADTLQALAPDPLRANGTMPDWSADGTRVVYVSSPDTLPLPFGKPGTTKGSLELLAYDATAGSWLGPKSLVKSSGENNYYPTFSPDNAWVAFNRAAGDSYDAPDAALWLVRANGASAPIELKNAGGPGNKANSWPKFSPFVQKYQTRRLMWLTFSSRRDYGLRLQGEGRAQIWMAAIDPGKAEIVTDPSYPAFWLPVQDIDTGNHIAQWTEQVVKKPCKVSGDCPGGEFCQGGFCERVVD